LNILERISFLQYVGGAVSGVAAGVSSGGGLDAYQY